MTQPDDVMERAKELSRLYARRGYEFETENEIAAALREAEARGAEREREEIRAIVSAKGRSANASVETQRLLNSVEYDIVAREKR
jgi:hypothetical protein